MNRREMISTSGLGIAGFAVGTGFTAPACGAKNLSGWVSSIVGAFAEMKPLLSQLGLSQVIVDKVSQWIDTAAKIARDFDQAYRDGKFADAVTLFNNLGGIVAQIAAELGQTDNRIVKLALVAIAVARIAIATLLNDQSSDPQVARAVRGAAANPAVVEIRRLASADIDKLMKALP